jgi:hypothetical protein
MMMIRCFIFSAFKSLSDISIVLPIKAESERVCCLLVLDS